MLSSVSYCTKVVSQIGKPFSASAASGAWPTDVPVVPVVR
jgi:hypothetical protein